MQINPAEDWHSLRDNYAAMLDGELELLSENLADLTAIAQQALRAELVNRGLGEPGAKMRTTGSTLVDDPRRTSSVDPDAGPTQPDDVDPDDDIAHRQFTWKTPLCECESEEQALAICEMLRQAGIERWYEAPGTGWSIGAPRVVVAADRLEEARLVVARPMPQDVLDDLREKAPEYEAPQCPKCGAVDPVLESAEPANAWFCEECGKRWTEPAADAEKAAQTEPR